MTGREVLVEMSASVKSAAEIVAAKGLKQVSDAGFIAEIVRQTLEECPGEVTSFRSGKETVLNFLFGQVMKKAAGKAKIVRADDLIVEMRTIKSANEIACMKRAFEISEKAVDADRGWFSGFRFAHERSPLDVACE